jgi:hypothetical protein
VSERNNIDRIWNMLSDTVGEQWKGDRKYQESNTRAILK